MILPEWWGRGPDLWAQADDFKGFFRYLEKIVICLSFSACGFWEWDVKAPSPKRKRSGNAERKRRKRW